MRWLKIIAHSMWLIAWLYCLGLILLAFGYWWIGEQTSILAFGLYLPPSLYFLPLALYFPIALISHRWNALLLAIVSILLGFYFFDYRFTKSSPAPNHPLKIYTFNRGQSQNTTQRPFIRATQPDLICFQEAPKRAEKFLVSPGYEDFSYGSSEGEFAVLSKWPITSKELIQTEAGPVIARFVVDWQDQAIAVYVLHLPTPRQVLAQTRSFSAIFLLAPWLHPRGEAKVEKIHAFWDRQNRIVEQISDRLRDERLPFILVGDTNAPSQGYLHRKLTSVAYDVHESVGQGSGFTFPGKTRNPLSWFGPWLRLDKIFVSSHWKSHDIIVEPSQPSQHRSVVATLSLKSQEN